MPTTSNFGWTTPADTDLVKDGAAAIRTLGNGIDTSLVDLKGGTTGQNLRKASNTDLDFTFAGDATNTVVDAAGDLLYGTAADTLGRLAIGTAGQVLKVNSGATAPEWGSAGSSFSGVFLAKTSNQSIANSTYASVTWQTERFDTDGYHSTVTNTERITIPAGKAGKYLLWYRFQWAANTTNSRRCIISKNGVATVGTDFNQDIVGAAPTSVTQLNGQIIVDLAVNDFIIFNAWQDSGGSLDLVSNTAGGDYINSYCGAILLGA